MSVMLCAAAVASAFSSGDGGGEGGARVKGDRGCASARVSVPATSMMSPMSASPRMFHRMRDAAAMARVASAIRLQPSSSDRVFLLSTVSSPSAIRASDSHASMASATSRARVGLLARDVLRHFLLGEGSDSGALGGALGLGPLSGTDPANETRLLTCGGLASSGEGWVRAAGPAFGLG